MSRAIIDRPTLDGNACPGRSQIALSQNGVLRLAENARCVLQNARRRRGNVHPADLAERLHREVCHGGDIRGARRFLKLPPDSGRGILRDVRGPDLPLRQRAQRLPRADHPRLRDFQPFGHSLASLHRTSEHSCPIIQTTVP